VTLLDTSSPLDVPTISKQEFKARLNCAQAMVRERGFDALLVNSNEADFANVRYFADYWPIFETAGVLIPAEGEAALLIGPESETFAIDRSQIPTIHKMVEYRESADPAYPDMRCVSFAEAFAQAGVAAPQRIGIAGYLVTVAPIMDGLREAFPNARIERADDIMVRLRSVKSEAEIACLREAFRISEIAMGRVLDMVQPGMTELQVVGVVQQAIYEHGAEYEGMPQYVLSGPNSRHAISRPTHRKLQRGDMLQLNLSARVSGYSSGVGVPVCLGPMTPRQRELVAFGLEAHNQTIQWMQSGVVASEVARKYRRFFDDRGYGAQFLYGPAHGLGMIEVEAPWVETISDYPLQPNMAFQIDTFLCDSEFGLRWENGGRITVDGFDLFSGQFRRMIEIK
jgi:Xaa-Pro aminopeptidase